MDMLVSFFTGGTFLHKSFPLCDSVIINKENEKLIDYKYQFVCLRNEV